MTNEPEIITHNREQLAYLLTEAAEIEHGLMCCYLFAAHTLRRGAAEGLRDDEVVAVERWRGAIVQVAVEEMLHLALVSNLLSAIGSAPHFQRPNFPVSPGYHPAGVVVSLAPFDRATPPSAPSTAAPAPASCIWPTPWARRSCSLARDPRKSMRPSGGCRG
jgi:hypothetical protein